MIEIKTPSHQEIESIIFDDEIYNRVADDSCPPKGSFPIPFHFYKWLGGYKDGKIIGLWQVADDRDMHFMVLKEYRKYASEFLQGCIKEHNETIYCEIPTLFQSVINFAKKHGFKDLGWNGKYYYKNNKSYKLKKLIFEV